MGDPVAMSRLTDLIDEAHEALYDDRVKDARRLLDEARRLDGRHPEVRLLEVDVLVSEDLVDEAIAAAEEALEDNGRSMIVKLRLATLLLDALDDVQTARPMLEDLARRLKKGEAPDVAADDAETKAEAATDFALEVWLTLADVRGADHDPVGALAAADVAVSLDKDDPMTRVARASALFDLGRLDEASAEVAKAIDKDPRCADAWWLRGRLATVKGDHAAADKAFEKAVSYDGDRFQPPFRIDEDAFAAVLEAAMAELPDVIRNAMKNVSVIVQDLPDLEVLQKSDPPLSPSAVGLFDPEPLAPHGGPGQPVRIFLFRKNLEVSCSTREEMVDEISVTLLHEIGHHLGLDEDDLDARGLN
jgi:predicted Zn-dependent protease with MMP-like domain/predicted negative regulator of RcsB-dependent stress response